MYRLLTPRQVANEIGLSDKTVRKLMASGRFPCYELHGRYYADQGQIAAFLASAERATSRRQAKTTVPDLLGD